MDYRSCYEKDFLFWTDLDGDTVVTIEKGGPKRVGRDKKKKLLLKYKEFEKPHIIPAKAVAPIIATLLGSEEVNDWVGKKITLYVEHGLWMKGTDAETDRAIRVRPKPSK